MGIPQFTMKQHPKKIIVVLLSGGFIFALGCFILLYFAGQKLVAQTHSDSQYLLSQVDDGVEESVRVLTKLNNPRLAHFNPRL
ncbi:hypothetical protein [Pseudoalteromonas sp. 5-MNA-CIBAN-0065]|uniref:hypothetical protein n=1 Tax=Pseudoalteromonas sp. 5-MNA-CIBAN-0065 TaxID=3140421 RepID=UPI00332B2566